MGTLTEKATDRPNTSMNSTDMISTGWRPNLRSKVSWRRRLETCSRQQEARRGASGTPTKKLKSPADDTPC
ncbi:hypothetical protein EYF80_013990 [Liparis tanakae]|uniref:Uncharacterized protein n=1 Tax=Liparis tanakae TaxID=230148 RepID=A0A4Z2IFG7_9TELE|nr:hypothetical protein EYF80_013990 [Liparis tanakae]